VAPPVEHAAGADQLGHPEAAAATAAAANRRRRGRTTAPERGESGQLPPLGTTLSQLPPLGTTLSQLLPLGACSD
jgi:hypothetical protein